MADARFFQRSGPIALADIAAHVRGELAEASSAAFLVHDIAPLDEAGDGDISVFSDRRYLELLTETRAAALITTASLGRHVPSGRHLIIVEQPRLAYAQVGHLFYPGSLPDHPGLAASATVSPNAEIGPGCQIDAGAVVEADARIGANSRIGSNAVIGRGVQLGEACRIGANVSISHALIGARVEIGSGTTIGSPGFGYEQQGQGLIRMLQVGRVIIEDDVDIGANSAIDRGATGDTVIGAGAKIDNLVQIGHNVRLGRRCVVCGQAGIAGSTTVGDGVVIGGGSSISDHLTIGSGARIAGKSGVMRDVEPGGVVAGYPALPVHDWHRQTAGLIRMFSRRAPKR
jgi:UDP-3-O-[3-hydroxymyristoyl] glucosamine N-acyltransferase